MRSAIVTLQCETCPAIFRARVAPYGFAQGRVYIAVPSGLRCYCQCCVLARVRPVQTSIPA